MGKITALSVLAALGLISVCLASPYGYTNSPVDGGWTEWSYGQCSATCGKGTVMKTRTCANPKPAHGGADCEGESKMTEECDNAYPCPIDGGWTNYVYGECSTTCGKGSVTKTRTCSNPKPAHGGAECEGESEMTEECDNAYPCPIDGGWSDYVYGECSTTCGKGSVTKTRTCSNPKPAHGGADCEGESEMTEECDNAYPCPIDGGWSDYVYGECSTTCGKGSVTKTRTCSNPKPAHGGAECEGESEMTEECDNAYPCPIDGGWSDYVYSECSTTCGKGSVTKTRTCSNPKPAHGGAECEGESEMTEECDNAYPCPIDGGWSDYVYGECSTTCGKGSVTKTRTCSNPKPAHGGADCQGESEMTEECVNDVQCSYGYGY